MTSALAIIYLVVCFILYVAVIIFRDTILATIYPEPPIQLHQPPVESPTSYEAEIESPQPQPHQQETIDLEDIPWDEDTLQTSQDNIIRHPNFNTHNYIHYIASGPPFAIEGVEILACATHKGKESTTPALNDAVCAEWKNWHTHYLLAIPLDQTPGERFGNQTPTTITIHRRWPKQWCTAMQKTCCVRNKFNNTVQHCKTCQSRNSATTVDTAKHFDNVVIYAQKRYDQGLQQWKNEQPALNRLHPKERRTRFNIAIRRHFNDVQKQAEIPSAEH